MKEITICLHCGCDRDIVNKQMENLKPLEEKYKIYWNNRIDRHPESYDSYSELINDSIITSKTEIVILINDRVRPKPKEVDKILKFLDTGFAAVTMYSVAFMGVTKELFRVLGFWDERFYGAGYEDDDFVLRLKIANLAYYESEEAEYDMNWQTNLRAKNGDRCSKSEPWFHTKWKIGDTEIAKVIKEENKYNKLILGERKLNISSNWMQWGDSIIGKDFILRMKYNKGGQSRTYWFKNWYDDGFEFKQVKDLTV